ncbi:MAG TPA: acyl carrier protein [Novosphingobium capsulatum]|jgi:acyl carrier protein|nr:acyl carrier protein [Novosphingobium aromaticivorans]HIQ19314.1 acyl carrier protein [Novosphingobium capsulatum]
MTRDDIVTTLTGIFRDIFFDDDLVLRDDMTADDVEDWTSLTHINLILAVEEAFEIKIRSNEIEKLTDVRALVDLIEKKVA